MATFTHGYNQGRGGGGANAIATGQSLNTANSMYPLPGQGGRASAPADAKSKFWSNAGTAGKAAAGAAFALYSGMQGIAQHQLDAETNNTSLAMQRLELYRNMGAAIGGNTTEAANSAFGTGAVYDLNQSLSGQADVQSAHYTALQKINQLMAKANERNQKIAAIIGAVNSAAASFAGG